MIEFYPSTPGLYYVDRQGKTIRLDASTYTPPPNLLSPENEILVVLLRYALKRMEKATTEKADPLSMPAPHELVKLAEQVRRALFR